MPAPELAKPAAIAENEEVKSLPNAMNIKINIANKPKNKLTYPVMDWSAGSGIAFSSILMGRTAWGCRRRTNSRRICLTISITRNILIPPVVEPAQPPNSDAKISKIGVKLSQLSNGARL